MDAQQMIFSGDIHCPFWTFMGLKKSHPGMRGQAIGISGGIFHFPILLSSAAMSP